MSLLVDLEQLQFECVSRRVQEMKSALRGLETGRIFCRARSSILAYRPNRTRIAKVSHYRGEMKSFFYFGIVVLFVLPSAKIEAQQNSISGADVIDKPRVFLHGNRLGNVWDAGRDQAMEMSQDFEKNCPRSGSL